MRLVKLEQMRNFFFLVAVAGFLMVFDFIVVNIPGFSKHLFSLIPSPKVANPATQYCLSQGGQRLIKKDNAGNVYSFCQLPDGSLCEEWAFYQKTCQRQLAAPTPQEEP